MRVPALVAAALAALVLGAGATSALAANRPTLTDEIAAQLGVSPEKLRAAVKAALVARVDAAVAAGKLTRDQGARLKERIAKANGLGLGARRAFAEKRKAFGDRLAKSAKRRGPAAEYLGMTREGAPRRAAQGPVARPDRPGARQERRRPRRGHGRAREGAACEGGRGQAADRSSVPTRSSSGSRTGWSGSSSARSHRAPPDVSRPATTSGKPSRTSVPPPSARSTVTVPPCSSTTRDDREPEPRAGQRPRGGRPVEAVEDVRDVVPRRSRARGPAR